MTRQYLRSYRVSISGSSGTVTVQSLSGDPGLRCRFKVTQSDLKTPNSAYITINNLSEATAQGIVTKEYDKVTLEVGYGENLAKIFSGSIVQRRKGRESPTDTYLEIIARDGIEGYSYGVASKTLAAGHTFLDQVNAVLDALAPFGIIKGFIADLGNIKMPTGVTLFGMAHEVLDDIAAATGTTWSIQNNALTMIKNDSVIPGGVTVLNSNTGLIGMPAQTLNGIEAKCLLNPQLVAGSTVQIDQKSVQQARLSTSTAAGPENEILKSISIAADGLYRLLFVDHEGDSRGTEWYSNLTCVALSSNKVPPGSYARGATIPDKQ